MIAADDPRGGRMNFRFLVLTLGAGMVVNCKPKPESGVVKSIDNVAAGSTVTENVCSGTFATPVSDGAIDVSSLPPATRLNLREAVLKGLSAVPPGLKNVFFDGV